MRHFVVTTVEESGPYRQHILGGGAATALPAVISPTIPTAAPVAHCDKRPKNRRRDTPVATFSAACPSFSSMTDMKTSLA
jgi:hypothetical protein